VRADAVGLARISHPVATAAAYLLALVAATTAGPVGCGAGLSTRIEVPPLSDGEREVYARQSLMNARLLKREGRLEAAERSTRRGLAYEPRDVRLHRLRAELLDALDQPQEAALHRQQADALDPPPPPLPDVPLPEHGSDLMVLLLPPPPERLATFDAAGRVPQDWPQGEVAETLASRLRTRLPAASVVLLPADEHQTSQSVSAARSWLEAIGRHAAVSLRVERAFCDSSIKDGDFAVGWLRLATAGGTPPSREIAGRADQRRARIVRHVVEGGRGEGCRSEAVARALEQGFEEPEMQALLNLPAEHASVNFGSREICGLFPELGRRIREEIDQGRRLLSLGQLGAAAEAFRRAAAIDPEDLDASMLLRDVQRALSISRQLSALDSASALDTDPELLEPHLSASQRRALEAQLAHEKRMRKQLLAALAVLGERRAPPSPETLAALRSSEVKDPEATGPNLARARTGGPEIGVAARVLMAPNGEIVTRYYFAEGSDEVLLREDDTDGDGRPDRWVGYENGVLREVWETSEGGDCPVLHMVYAADGVSLERIEIDRDCDGNPERVLRYSAGLLELESWDSDTDGRFDRFQHFDETGSLTLLEEDLDADGVVDVRTLYHNGQLTRREITNP
jgi:hypothetical protein